MLKKYLVLLIFLSLLSFVSPLVPVFANVSLVPLNTAEDKRVLPLVNSWLTKKFGTPTPIKWWTI